MKLTESTKPFFVPEPDDMIRDIDTRIKQREIFCRCGNSICLPETYLNEESLKEVELLSRRVKCFMDDTTEAIVELYGHDPRHDKLMRMIEEFRARYFRPELTLVKGEVSK